MAVIYFDHASTTPIDPGVVKAMEPFLLDRFGNPSSPHTLGQQAQKAVETAREVTAAFISASANEVIFNSGATEGMNHALFGIARSSRERGKHFIASSIEHHCVKESLNRLQEDGYQVSYVPVDGNGLIDPQEVKRLIRKDTIGIIMMHANNEIGTIEPIAEIGLLAREHQVPFIVDAAQSVGHIPLAVDHLNADVMAFSAHKCYGPKGVGALYIRTGSKVSPFLLGGNQEGARRASTQNVPGIVGLARALELCHHTMHQEMIDQARLRDRLIREIEQRIDGVKINGHVKQRLPNNVHCSFENVKGESLLISLDMAGICASMGSACKSGSVEASHVLKAIGLSDQLALGSLRLSLGRWTNDQEIKYLLDKLPRIIRQLRG